MKLIRINEFSGFVTGTKIGLLYLFNNHTWLFHFNILIIYHDVIYQNLSAIGNNT